ncbi:MAG: ABC transporter ATP-binding protein [Opitutales bacterium]|nr:ABC transporter ATP-binding protein [Opitutales bacterium]
MNKPIIEVSNLGKCYRLGELGAKSLRDELTQLAGRLKGNRAPERNRITDFWAVRDVSFQVKKGDVIGIIGKNGAGKSTLLKLLSRITEPTEGEAFIRGRVASLLEVGTGFHPELTGRDNIYLSGTILGMSRREIKERFDEIVSFAGIEKHIDTPVKRYSSGMYVRLGFAVAAHLNSEILLVDEVLAVGDVTYRKQCIEKMKSLAKEGRTIFFVSHQLDVLSNLCPRSIRLHKGELTGEGDTEDLIQDYLKKDDDSNSSSDSIWEGSEGDDIAKIESVKLKANDVPSDNVDIDLPIDVEIGYRCLKDSARLNASVILNNSLGAKVFSSPNLPSAISSEDQWGYQPHSKGTYVSRMTIPANFLNDGLYSCDICLSTDASHTNSYIESAVSFTVHDTGSMRKEFQHAWWGILRPKMHWKTEKTD